MAELQLPVTVEYVSTKEAYEMQARLVYGDYLTRLKEHDRGTTVMFLFLSLSGIFAAASAGRMGLLLVIVAGSAAIGRQLWKDYKSALQAVDHTIEKGVGKGVRIEIDERGFVGHYQGIESFSPWSAMKDYCVLDDLLMIELANGFWFVIPAATLKPESVSLEHLEGILFKHGVSKRG